MPKRTDLKTILIIGSGPIVIGQACEFDYSGAQACKALREEGYRVVLVNSNPATIMTDPDFADATYVEPLTPQILEKIIEREKPDALLPTLGGQTGLNLSLQLAKLGILEKYGVELIGAKEEAINRGENRKLFRQIMLDIGLDIPQSQTVETLEEARTAASEIGAFPLIIRPSFTLGGTGGGIAYNREEFDRMVAYGLDASPVTEVLIEECLLGWKEFEMEVMRDHKDQCVVICSIENFDPMGVHTGDSITVAPAMTLSDKEYQLMRDASFAVIRAIGVETGGSNIQFAINPENGRMIVIEMNPRVSRSSALASKATGFPIAKIAAKLAVGYSMDELRNDITRETPASFEPTIDYVVTKMPRFAFEKFVGADQTLTSSMKSVGEAMAIGRTFKESFQKALRSLEIGSRGFGGGGKYGIGDLPSDIEIRAGLAKPTMERVFYIRYAMLAGFSMEEIFNFTKIDPWFLHQLREIVDIENALFVAKLSGMTPELLRKAKESGFSDVQLAHILNTKIRNVKKLREDWDVKTVYRLVDTCAAEFEAYTPYYYSTYGLENEIVKSDTKKVMIIGGGPNRIGQGIEFDYCCVHASYALREAGYETVMINSNPETVSTDYDTSDRLFFEPLTLEDVLEVYHQEGCMAAIVQFGGQTPLNLATQLKENGVNIIGTSPEMIDAAEDRERFKQILDRVGLKQPRNATALAPEQAYELAGEIGFPILLRPSFVLGGRGMFIVYDTDELKRVIREAFDAAPGHPVLIDKFLEDAIELDVDAISDGETVVIGGMLEHIEYAGVHSGDAAMVMPPHTLSKEMLDTVRTATFALARELEVIGLMNVQYAIKDDELYILEVNPRASRTAPFISKAIGKPLAKYAARVMAGEKLTDIGFTEEIVPHFWAVKESVFPFIRFPGAPITLSPEMRSTGEVMGLDHNLGLAIAKSQMAAQPALPTEGNVFLSVRDKDKPRAIELAKELVALGFKLHSTSGTAKVLEEAGLPVKRLFKLSEGARPNVIDMLKNNQMSLIINTPSGQTPRLDENQIREEAVLRKVCIMTTLSFAEGALNGIKALKEVPLSVRSLQEFAQEL
ncbi:carbamoyl-phosphate synthase large subunit [Cerasicoccus arenae]|uniref:Carbamoyl phosphate synthase large chain n=1 Tax=Cerasicoccus arenae TaxID=424488 RepID=A0A8J3GDU9_9BACT|nr:carbamoyl-phosphate synthase large subunit [Cerasicoccus arenae]MBK1858677.1 carbamoyl-phosphate synthase large subunit [Cerasicoccus arenae]GHB98259.1 carbamoyl-phosphate synthase (glutamine-hydrolyzing) [Cerasicoccus arenae]